MGRYTENKAYGAAIEKFYHDCFRLHWTIDRYYSGSRLRHPTRQTRDTDLKGAIRFAKKHGIDFDPIADKKFWR